MAKEYCVHTRYFVLIKKALPAQSMMSIHHSLCGVKFSFPAWQSFVVQMHNDCALWHLFSPVLDFSYAFEAERVKRFSKAVIFHCILPLRVPWLWQPSNTRFSYVLLFLNCCFFLTTKVLISVFLIVMECAASMQATSITFGE